MPSKSVGFGEPQPKHKPSPRSTQRAQAAKQYEQMKTDGMPDYEVYIRIQGKKNWYPVGVVAVKRSNQISQAIFANQQELLQGGFRLYPVLRKHQQHLEYGYRLKAYKDEPIQVAVPSRANPANGISNLFTDLKDRVTSLLKRKPA